MSQEKIDALNKALQNEWITPTQYEDEMDKVGIVASPNSNGTKKGSNFSKIPSRLEAIEKAKSEGWIDNTEYERLTQDYNPSPNNVTKDKSLKRGLAFGARNALASVADLADLVASPVSASINLGRHALGKSPIPSLGQATTNSIDNLSRGYTKPQDEHERLLEGGSRAVGVMPGAAGLGMALKAMKNAPGIVKGVGNFLAGSNKLSPKNIGATAGSSAAATAYSNSKVGRQNNYAVNPDEKNEDLIGILGTLGTGALGGLIGGIAGKGTANLAKNIPAISKVGVSKRNIVKLPEYTAAQEAPLNSKRSGEYIGISKDLAASDPVYARKLRIMQRRQHRNIGKDFESLEKTSGREVADQIAKNFDEAKTDMRNEYVQDRNKIFENIERPNQGKRFDTKTGKPLPSEKYPKIETDDTLELIDSLYEQTAIDDSRRKLLADMADEVRAQKGNPLLLDDLKKSWGEKAKYHPLSALNLGNRKTSALNMLTRQLSGDLKAQIPGYEDLLSRYESKRTLLDKLSSGIVGDYVKSAENKPNDLINKLFTLPSDPESVDLIKRVMGNKLYDKAANTYLHDAYSGNFGKASRNQKNSANNMYRLQESLQNNPNLELTLPEKQLKLRNKVINDIKKSELGVPRGDYVNEINREMVKGNETKGIAQAKNIVGKLLPATGGGIVGGLLGIPGGSVGMLSGAAAGAGLGGVSEKIRKQLQHNLMMTGVKPQDELRRRLSRLGEGVKNDLSESKLPAGKFILQNIGE